MLEEEEGLKGLLKYVVYPDKGGTWRVQAVPTSSGSFNNRLGLYLCHASSTLVVYFCIRLVMQDD